MDAIAVKKYYNEAPTIKLLELARKPQDLDGGAIPLLLKELQKRKESDAVDQIEAFLNGSNKDIGEINYDELREEIIERLKNGEDIETIKGDIKERVGNVYEYFSRDLEGEEFLNDDQFIKATVNILKMREQNVDEEDIIESLKDAGISGKATHEIIEKSIENRTEILEKANLKLKRRTRNDLIWGPIILIIGLTITIVTLEVGDGSAVIAYGAILVGLIRLIRGIALKGKTINEV